MTALRRTALVALLLAYAEAVFGAIVRISHSGLGCGDHWPDCNGALVPALSNYSVAVEVTHRYIAAALCVAVVALVLLARHDRARPGVGGHRGVYRAAGLALALVLAAALIGMLVVRLSLASPHLIAVHYMIALAIGATLVVAAQRAGALGATATPRGGASRKTYRGAYAGAALAFVTVVLGALTANVPGAATSCQGFPWCRTAMVHVANGGLHIQITHRVLAALLLLHLIALAIGVASRRESAPIVRFARAAAAVVILQWLVAGAMVELHLPALQSLHQATGTLVWLVTFAFAALARRVAVNGAPA